MAALHPGVAEARVFFGFGFPVYGPYYPPPPVYYPPPVVYAPPPPAYSPAPPVSAGQTCFAGQYTCPMEHPVAYGASCYCSGNDGQRVFGRAN
jgi:hypothetical protein